MWRDLVTDTKKSPIPVLLAGLSNSQSSIASAAHFRDKRTKVKGILLFITQTCEFDYFKAAFRILPGTRHRCQDDFFSFFSKTCSDFTWNKTLLNQPDIICLGLSASLLPGRRNAALRGWMSTTADCKWRKEPVTVLPAQRNTHAGSWGPSLTWTSRLDGSVTILN